MAEKPRNPGWMLLAGLMALIMVGVLVFYKGCADWTPKAKTLPAATTVTQAPATETLPPAAATSGAYPEGQLPSRREGEIPVEPFDSSAPASSATSTTTTVPHSDSGMAPHRP